MPGGKQDGQPLPPPSGGRDTGHSLLRAVRSRAGGVLRYRRDVAQLRKLGSEKGRVWHMTQGRVLWYCDEIGYGFIHPNEGVGKNPRAPPRYRRHRAQVPQERRQGNLRGDWGQRGYGSQERLHGLTNQVRARPEMGDDQRRNRVGTLSETLSKRL